ncbi:MAG: NAD(P)-dependent oxidoreductase [Bacteroidota bacterium]|nr:NAD(P)-dependent oxidoreductase [Bacteroidota bacterium]MDP4212857.1 NAD(P)-dependent oxidoreductase [Bacteroidota bacterium]MDP4250353.1 NAD(P)-dependent oxidoreductase [Bacteroidota bacterium]
MDTYLITGGAGFLGINLTRYLLERGHRVVSLDIADFDYPEKNIIQEIKGDIRDRAAVDRAMQGVDFVVHTAAALPLYKKQDIYSTDLDGTRNVLQSALDNGVQRVVHISSTAVYGVPDHHPLVEEDKLFGVGDYGICKVKAESICVEFREKGLCVPVFRPKSFIGPERLGVFGLFYDWAKDGRGFPVLGNGNNKYQLMDVEDFCAAIYLSTTIDRNNANDTFNVGAKLYTTIKQDYQAVLDRAGFGKKITGVPAGFAIGVLRILNKLHISPLYPWVYETASKDSFVSIEKAQRVLGFAPKYSNQDALLRNYDWYIANMHHFQQSATGISHRVPWKQGALGIVKKFF